jgi:2-dehydropantoate 2-reductase
MASHWHVLGAGAIGCLLASKLQQAGCEVTLIVRGNGADTSAGDSPTTVKITSGGRATTSDFPVSLPTDTRKVSHLLLTTKAYDARSALASIAHRLDEHSTILLMTNGMGVCEEVQSDHPQLHFYCGTTTEGAYRQSASHIVHAGNGITKIGGENCVQPPPWFIDWSGLSIACAWDGDINRALWEKMAVNCAINPLTALFRCANGELLSRPEIAQQLGIVCAEIVAVSAAAGQSLPTNGLSQMVEEVIAKTAVNRSSMLQDVLAGRPTEIEYISGYLVRRAKELKLPTPLNEHLLAEVGKLNR